MDKEGKNITTRNAEKGTLPRSLWRYQSADFITKKKVKFAYYLAVALLVLMVVTILGTVYQQVHNPIYQGVYLPILIPIFLVLLIFGLCVLLIVRGFFVVASHLMIVTSIVAVWTVMITDQNPTLGRLDSIAFIFAVLSMLPVLVGRRGYSIIGYTIVNLLGIILFVYIFKNNLDFSTSTLVGFIIDTTTAMAFVGFLGFIVYKTNQEALERAKADIDERKVAENALRQSKELLQTVIESTPSAIALTDMQGRYILVNKTFCIESGYQSSEVIGKTSEEAGIRLSLQAQQAILDGINKKGFAENIEATLTGKGGVTQDIYISCKVITLDGEPAVLTSSANITEKKKVERELELYRNNLEQMVQDKTEEIAQANEELTASNEELSATNEELYNQRRVLEATLEDLKRAQKQLVQSEKMASLGILSAGVAHEINNPLNFISGGIRAIEEYVKGTATDHATNLQHLFDVVNQGVHRTTQIVSSLNRFCRQTENHRAKCNLHEIIDDCLQLLSNEMEGRIQVDRQYLHQSISVECNPSRLSQAVMNILLNAVQAIDDKGVVCIETGLENGQASILIKDTGKGINPEHLGKVFDPFFTTKEPGKGTGLGLATTYETIKEMKGTIEFNSTPGLGTEVRITIPTMACSI